MADEFSITVVGTNEKRLPATMQRESRPRNEITSELFKIVGGLWFAAIVSIVIPVFHFILVPGLFIAGIIAAIFISRRNVELRTSFECPGCGQRIEFHSISNGNNLRWPIDHVCPHCGQNMWFELAS
jgi:hypothetical protein